MNCFPDWITDTTGQVENPTETATVSQSVASGRRNVGRRSGHGAKSAWRNEQAGCNRIPFRKHANEMQTKNRSGRICHIRHAYRTMANVVDVVFVSIGSLCDRVGIVRTIHTCDQKRVRICVCVCVLCRGVVTLSPYELVSCVGFLPHARKGCKYVMECTLCNVLRCRVPFYGGAIIVVYGYVCVCFFCVCIVEWLTS